MDRAPERAHLLHLRGGERPPVDGRKILPKLGHVPRSGEHHVHVRAREAEPVAVARRRDLSFPSAGSAQQLPPRRRGVGDHGGTATGQVREDLDLGPGVRGVVADHQEVEDRFLRQFPGPGPVVDRDPQRADLPLFPEPGHLFLDRGGERGHLPEPVELEDVQGIDAKRPQRRLGRAADGAGEIPEQGAGGDHVPVAVPREGVPEGGGQRLHPGRPEDVLHAFQRLAAPRLVEAEGAGKTEAEEAPAETRHLPMGEFVHPGIISLKRSLADPAPRWYGGVSSNIPYAILSPKGPFEGAARHPGRAIQLLPRFHRAEDRTGTLSRPPIVLGEKTSGEERRCRQNTRWKRR